MSVVKAFKFPVSVHWYGGRLTRASAEGKRDLEIATPPEFRGGMAGVWTPEDLLVASAAACYAVTLAAVAERRNVRLHGLDVHGTGHVTKRDDGRFGFVAIDLGVSLETAPDTVQAAKDAAALAKEICLVSMALEVPVHVELAVRATAEPKEAIPIS